MPLSVSVSIDDVIQNVLFIVTVTIFRSCNFGKMMLRNLVGILYTMYVCLCLFICVVVVVVDQHTKK